MMVISIILIHQFYVPLFGLQVADAEVAALWSAVSSVILCLTILLVN